VNNLTVVATWKCKTPFTRYSQLYNRFDSRLYRVYKHSTGCSTCFMNSTGLIHATRHPACCSTGLTTVEQPALSCKETFNRLSNRLLSNRLYNWLNVCLHDAAGCSTGCQTVVSCKRGLTIRYDAIRYTIFMLAQKLTNSQLNLPHRTKEKRVMKKLKQQTEMLRKNGPVT